MPRTPPVPAPPARSGDPWTDADVKRWLVIPMRMLREQGLMAGAGDALIPTNRDTPQATFDILAFARTVLGKGSDELRAVTTWARIMAEGGDTETSIAEWCRGWGWKERSFYRRLNRGIARIVEAKNRVDCRFVSRR